jgi:5-methylcytosine-specific restriction enzyme subunit McrC
MNGEGQISITLSEWETASPATCPQLEGFYLDGPPVIRKSVEQLCATGKLQLQELRQGLEITTRSFVGRINIGRLSVTILPKVKSGSLLTLLRYAYGLRKLHLSEDTHHDNEQRGIEDLLVAQLNAEAQELLHRGLQRSYLGEERMLASPRGRIQVEKLARRGGLVATALPCRHFPRLENTLLNRILMAGLLLGAGIAGPLELKRESRRLANQMDEQVSRLELDGRVFEKAQAQLNRLTAAYVPALSIIQLLMEAKGIVLRGSKNSFPLPGFLFDMNRFFQALLSRFLRENLEGLSVQDEHTLHGMMRFKPAFNPQRRQSPQPRPDFAILQNKKLIALLDAKYRDLWENPLPREMLYQLVIYAIGDQRSKTSTILYPATSNLAREARIEVSDPFDGGRIGEVSLRPVYMEYLAEMIQLNSRHSHSIDLRRKESHRLVFGEI